MGYSYTDIDLSEDKHARIIDILDIIQNMDDVEVAEWIAYILTQDKIEEIA